MKSKYKDLYRKAFHVSGDDAANETTEVMSAIQDLPDLDTNIPDKETTEEHNSILQTLYDSKGIRTSFNHDKVEQPLLDRKIVRDGAGVIAQRAMQALKNSAKDYMKNRRQGQSYIKSEKVGLSSLQSGIHVKSEHPVKREPDGNYGPVGRSMLERGYGSASAPLDASRISARSGTSSADILEGLKQLAAIREAAKQKAGLSQSEEAARFLSATVPKPKQEDKRQEEPVLDAATVEALLDKELHESDRRIAEMILHAFMDVKIAGSGHCLTTNEVLEYLACDIAPHHNDLFKSLLREMCVLSKPAQPGQPGVWSLRPEYWPAKREASGCKA